MDRRYKRQRYARRSSVLAMIALAFFTPTAFGVVARAWKQECVGGLDCLFDFCWCEGEWNDTSNWVDGEVADDGADQAVFNRNNYTASCPIGTTEGWLQVNLTANQSIHSIKLRTTMSMQGFGFGGGSDRFRIAFTGDATVTASSFVQINATNGPITFEVKDGARVNTQ